MDLKLATEIDADNPTVGDLYLDETATIPTVDGNAAIVQHVWIRLRRFKREWFMNLEDGIPKEEVLGKVVKARARRVLERVVKSTPGIATLDSMDIELDGSTRVMTVSNLKATTVDGIVLGPEDFGDMEIRI